MVRLTARFILSLVLGLALLTWAAATLVYRTTGEWFEKDVRLRADLAVNGARAGLLSHWNPEGREAVATLLAEIERDERILGAAACGTDSETLAATRALPPQFDCKAAGAELRRANAGDATWETWRTVASLPGGRVHVSAIPLLDGDRTAGFVVLVHDLSFIDRREATVQWFLLSAFGFLVVASAGLTLLIARIAWRSWSREVRRALNEESEGTEFQPLLKDVHELIERIVSERQADTETGVWGPERLKQTLHRFLHGEKVVVVANREPYIHTRGEDGSVRIQHPASGLVTAVEPILRACSGVWIAHGSGDADRENSDPKGRLRVPPGEESYVLRRLWLTPEQEKGYYYGFANEGLWPLCHIAHTRPVFRSDDWKHYKDVNRRFADAVVDEVDVDDPIVLVQDYHFALAPLFIRERLPRATVISFWHIPWPNAERFGICPWRNELLEGLLGGSIVGFHTRFHCNNFVDAVDRFLEARIDREQQAIVQQGRTTLVRPYPIATEWPVRWLSELPSVEECRKSVIAELGLRDDALVGVGVDRLDYTKGIDERMLAVERLLDKYPSYRGRFTFVQLAAPSRTEIERYRELDRSVERTFRRINERFGSGTYRPIILLRAHHEPQEVFRYYRAADLCYVSSLHDGMNLVAKEFVAARDDEDGALILSQFTGAARELTQAFIVNPYDIDEAAAALAAALEMPPDERRARMRSMRAYTSEFNVYRWAGRMLVEAARLRDHDRLVSGGREGGNET